MDQKSWPDRPKPLIYMNEKDWKKDGLNPPVFPLAGLMLLIRSHMVRPLGAPAWCARLVRPPCVRVDAWMSVCVCVRVSVRVVVWCSRECTRGGPEGRLSVIV